MRSQISLPGLKRKLSFFVPLLAFFINSCKQAPPLLVSYNNSKLAYMGRISSTDSAAMIYWSGSSVTMSFTGTEVRALLKDERGRNYFNVIIDSTDITQFHVEKGKQLYTLISHLNPGRHSIQLFKRTESTNGKTWFYGFMLSKGDSLLSPPAAPERRMEFYGNSITSGYAVDDAGGDSQDPKYMNNYLSYAALTARHYNAAYHCISKSGIGIMVSWFPVIMPELYDRLDPADSGSKWDFSKYLPDIVVTDLGQNDSWLVKKPGHKQFNARFGAVAPTEESIISAYKSFLQTIRVKYPAASIICTTGDMDATAAGSPWPGYIKKAVTSLKDPKIYSLIFPYKGTPGHPKAKDHEQMAAALISFIDSHVKWQTGSAQ